MPPRSPEPLRKVTFNLFDADCDAMERRYGHGWSERIRLMVREHLKKLKQPTLDEVEMFVEDDDA